MTLRLGRIGYVNMAPVFYRLDYDVEEIGATSTSPSSSIRLSSVGTPTISSTSCSSRKKTGAMFT